MTTLDELKIDPRFPHHIAIIMDGNGRWAQAKGLERVYGHAEGINAVKRTLRAAGEIGLKYLTLYTFSTENWNRPKEEVNALMGLMVDAIANETAELMSNNVCVQAIGNLGDLPDKVRNKFGELVFKTSVNTGVKLVLALSYSSRWEIVEASRRIAEDCKSGKILTSDIDTALFSSYLTTSEIPDPDMIIRTGGESRLSNFLLWQSAYTEFYFVEKYWPDFGRDDLIEAVSNYLTRERRFGKTGAQVKAENQEKTSL